MEVLRGSCGQLGSGSGARGQGRLQMDRHLQPSHGPVGGGSRQEGGERRVSVKLRGCAALRGEQIRAWGARVTRTLSPVGIQLHSLSEFSHAELADFTQDFLPGR